MKAIIIGIVVLTTVLAIVFGNFAPKESVAVPEVKKISEDKRPVREGNCWRQWDTKGNSMLVCH